MYCGFIFSKSKGATPKKYFSSEENVSKTEQRLTKSDCFSSNPLFTTVQRRRQRICSFEERAKQSVSNEFLLSKSLAKGYARHTYPNFSKKKIVFQIAFRDKIALEELAGFASPQRGGFLKRPLNFVNLWP